MVVFRCPVCGDKHSVPDNYDNKDYICSNTSNRIRQRTFQDLTPEDIYTRPMFTMNRHSTKVDEARPATVNVGDVYRRVDPSKRIGQELDKNY